MVGWTDLFTHFDEGFLDDEFDSDFEESFKEVLGGSNLSCEECGKLYKTAGGLNRHKLKKHNDQHIDEDEAHLSEDNHIVIDKAIVLELVKQCQDKIFGDENYEIKFRSVIKNFNFIDEECSSLLCDEIVNIMQKMKHNKNAEEFYKLYFSSVVKDASKYFHGLKAPMCTLLAQTLSDGLLAEIVKKNRRDNDKISVESAPITERERDALQYLGGYVISKLLKKANKFRDDSLYENQAIILILSAAKAPVFSQLKLVDAVNRGGLCKITSECENIFLIAERVFRDSTSKNHLRKINTNEMVVSLVNDFELISHFNAVVADSSCKPSKEIQINLLEKMLGLYLRVRAFSLAKDLTARDHTNKTRKDKALRKELKKADSSIK